MVRNLCRAKAHEHNKMKEAKSLASSGTVASVEKLARYDQRTAVGIGELDADPWILNTPEGTLDLTTGGMAAHSPVDKLTKIAGTSPKSNCPTPIWDAFLARVTSDDAELIAFLQRMAGYMLTGETHEHALFFLYGKGSNGKSTFLNVLTTLLGDYHATATMEVFTASINDRHPTELASLRGARMVTSVETEEGRRWAE
jgi:putative DNA primase/helicase